MTEAPLIAGAVTGVLLLVGSALNLIGTLGF